MLVISLHRFGADFYPFDSGPAGDTGAGAGAGFNVNLPFPDAQLGGSDYGAAFAFLVSPLLRAFRPALLLVSAGFDAAANDPLGGCAARAPAFASMLAACAAAQPRLVAVLEGGYEEGGIADCVEATLRAMLFAAGRPGAAPQGAHAHGGAQREPVRGGTPGAVRAAREALRPFWADAVGGGDAQFDDWCASAALDAQRAASSAARAAEAAQPFGSDWRPFALGQGV